MHHRFEHIHPMINLLITDILQEITQIKTPDNDLFPALSDFVFKIPSSKCQHKLLFSEIFSF